MADAGHGACSVSTTVKPRGRGKAKATMEQIETCLEILREIQPATVRAVCYRLFTMGLIPDMGKNSTSQVSRNLVWAREQGLLPWDWVVDETREAERTQTWANPDQIIVAAVHGYRRDYWQDQSCRVEVWSEKGTVRGTLAPVLNEFGVTFRVMHGFASATAVNDIAEMSNESDKPLIALYAGDFDPSGRYMSDVDLPQRIERYGGNVEIHRVALMSKDTLGLPHFSVESKTGDARYSWFVENYGSRCWELDAMSPPLLRKRVRDAIVARIDVDSWNHALIVEQAEVESMRQFHQQWAQHMGAASA